MVIRVFKYLIRFSENNYSFSRLYGLEILSVMHSGKEIARLVNVSENTYAVKVNLYNVSVKILMLILVFNKLYSSRCIIKISKIRIILQHGMSKQGKIIFMKTIVFCSIINNYLMIYLSGIRLE